MLVNTPFLHASQYNPLAKSLCISKCGVFNKAVQLKVNVLVLQISNDSPLFSGTVVWHGNASKWIVVTGEHEGEGKESSEQCGGHAQLDDAGARQPPALHQPAARERAPAPRRHCDHTWRNKTYFCTFCSLNYVYSLCVGLEGKATINLVFFEVVFISISHFSILCNGHGNYTVKFSV